MSAEQIAFFRSRYTEKETSPMLPENQPKSEFFKTVLLWWSRIKCCYRCFCGSRFRLALSLLALLILMMLLRDASVVTKWMFSYKDTAQSSWQSYGLLHEPLWKWQSRKGYYASIHAMDLVIDDPHIPLMDASSWFEKYGKIDFVCPTEQAVNVGTTSTSTTSTNNNDNNKWYLCNPQAMAQHHRGCLIYTTGRPDAPQHRFEHALLQAMSAISKPCEIHVFDPFATSNEDVIHVPLMHGTNKKSKRRHRQDETTDQVGGENGDETVYGNETTTIPVDSSSVRGNARMSTITVHPWGLTGAASSNHHQNTTSDTKPSSDSSKLALKTLSETWQLLNHDQRTLDLLVLDCAGCEWDVYTELIEPAATTTSTAAASGTLGAGKTTIKPNPMHPSSSSSDHSQQQQQRQQPALPLQVLMQIHALPSEGSGGISGNDYHSLLLHHMSQQHYVRFHRVPQIWSGQWGHAQAYSFLKLRSAFFS